MKRLERSFHPSSKSHRIATSHNLTRVECREVEALVRDNLMTSPVYKLKQECGVFLQGFQFPGLTEENDGWVMLEFWSDNNAAIDAFIELCEKSIEEKPYFKLMGDF